jgi:hypothetical protein
LKISCHLGHVAAVEEFALQKSTETRAEFGNERLAYAPRAFLRIFHHKHVQPPLASFCGVPWCRYFGRYWTCLEWATLIAFELA